MRNLEEDIDALLNGELLKEIKSPRILANEA